MARDFTMTVNVRLDRVFEMKPPKGGRRTYLLIDNTSAAAIKYEHGTSPSDFLGETIPSGGRYERDNKPPQSVIFIRGSLLTDQLIVVGQGFE